MHHIPACVHSFIELLVCYSNVLALTRVTPFSVQEVVVAVCGDGVGDAIYSIGAGVAWGFPVLFTCGLDRCLQAFFVFVVGEQGCVVLACGAGGVGMDCASYGAYLYADGDGAVV